ncbi:MAG: hypothetical protein Q7R81_03570 [Candidatus Peregrinibacteria bacterium]|nr:hypothetical protein [Candidatus Peregrinibacteria bacterium]
MIGHLQELLKLGLIEFSKSARIDDPPEVIADPSYAQELFDRHRSLNIAKKVASTVLKTGGDPQHPEMQKLYRSVAMDGGFLLPESMGYSIDDFSGRLRSPERWKIAHARGSIVDSKAMQWTDPRYVADIQVQVAPDDPQTPLLTYVPSTDHPQDFHDHKREKAMAIADALHANHAILAVIEDVGVAPEEYHRKGFGSRLRNFAIENMVRELVNACKEREHKVRFMLANMFSIEEVRSANRVVRLERPLRNEVSIIMHALAGKYDSCLAWSSPPSEVPVQLSPDDGHDADEECVIRAGWETAAIVVPE